MDNVSSDGDKTLCENIKDTTGCREEDTDKDHMARFNERNPENYMSAVECLRLRSSLVEILEELKLRRMNDKDNEERIKRADQEKYQLIRKCESESQKLNEATKQYRKHLQDKDRMCEEKLSRMEEQLKQHKVFKDCTDKEINLLKDEIRKLEVVKYKLEKDVTEQERKLHLHVQSSEQHLNQLTETEESFKSLYTQCKQLSEAQAQLEESVQHAIKHNQALRYINEHQKCIVDEEKSHSLSLQAQLLEVRSLLQQRPDETSLQQYQQEIRSLNHRSERATSEKEKAEEEIKELETKYEKVTQILEDTNRLVVRQIENVELHKKNSSQQTLVIEQLQKELSMVKGELQEVKAKNTSQTEQHKKEAKEWRQKNSQLQNEMNKISEELADQKKTCSDLEELNTTWSNQNIQLTQQLHSIKELMNKPKQEQIQQTSLSWMNMVEQVSQTEVIHADISIQTYTAPQRTESSQTLVPDFTVSATQTRNPALANSSSQTDKAVLHNVSVQAEIIKYNSKERLFSLCMPPPTSSLKILSQQSLASQTDMESVFADCSQYNSKTVSGKTSQSQQDTDLQSVSQPESQAQSVITSQSLPADESQAKSVITSQSPPADESQAQSVITSQSLPADESQPQNVGSQLVSEDASQSMTVDSSLSETSRQVKADSVQTSTEDDVQETSMEHQSVAKRHSFQFSSSSNISKVITSSRQSVPEYVSRENTFISKNDNSVEWRDGHRTVEDGAEMIGEVPADISKMETDIEHKICSESLGKDHIDNKRDTQTKISSDHGPTKLCESDPTDCGNDRNKNEEVDQSSNAGGTSPRSPGGSRLKLSLSKLRNPTTLCQTHSIDLSFQSTPKPEGQKVVVESLKLNQHCDIRDVKGILKGQENDYKRKTVSFGSPLQNVQQISQTSVESESRDDGDKDLFSDSEDDTEDRDYKERPSEKCLPATTLIIGNKRVESVNSVASLVDEYLPDTSLPKNVSVLAVNDEDDLEMPSTNTTSINKEMKWGKSITSTNSPCGNDQSTLKLLSRDKTSVCVANRGMPVLEIPSVPKLPPSTLSNQYKRTIDAILNKGKKRKTDH